MTFTRSTLTQAAALALLTLAVASSVYATLIGNKGSAMANGTNIKYDSGKCWFATLKYEQESGFKNHAESSSPWLKALFPL
jgi:hypothetical protein